jgi:hypothetical protein
MFLAPVQAGTSPIFEVLLAGHLIEKTIFFPS